MAGFFSASTRAKWKPPAPTVAKCGACGLLNKCLTPKMPTVGKGRGEILIVGSGPMLSEDRAGAYLGGLMGAHVSALGIDIMEECWYTTAAICHGKITAKEVEYCQPNLKKTIKALKPRVIITVGQQALKGVLSWLWRPDCGTVQQWAGQQVPSVELNAWICPVYDPADLQEHNHACLDRYFERHLEAAMEAVGRPWPDGAPNHSRQIKPVFSDDEAVRILDKMTASGAPVSFDYETNCLKPEWDEARVVSAAVCWRGKRTIAFPWQGEAVKAFSRLLRSPCPKVAANLAFEERWSIASLGHGANNWIFDTMQAAHVMDNQKGILSVSFQAFARLGVSDHEDHIKPFLKSAKGARTNRIHEIDLTDLLTYNGLDCVYEYEIARQQMNEIGIALPENY